MQAMSSNWWAHLSDRTQKWTLIGSLAIFDYSTEQGAWTPTLVIITPENVLEDSFILDCQSGSDSEMMIGAVYSSSCELTLTGLDRSVVTLGGMTKATLALSVRFDNTDTYYVDGSAMDAETMPLGVFNIQEAYWTLEGLHITGYDNMIKLDVPFTLGTSATHTAYEWYNMICSAAGATPGTTQAEFEANHFVNHTVSLPLYDSNGAVATKTPDSIGTLRDLLFYLSQAIGGYAFANGNGEIELVAYWNRDDINPVSIFADENPVAGSFSVSDKPVRLSGFILKNDDGSDRYYGYDGARLSETVDYYRLLADKTDEAKHERQQDYANYEDELSHLEDEYAAGRITLKEYTAQRQTLQDQITEADGDIIALTTALNNIADQLTYYSNKANEYYDGAGYFDFSSNPFLGFSKLTGPTDAAEVIRWNLAEMIADIDYHPFNCELVGFRGYEPGRLFRLYPDGRGGTGLYGKLNGYTYDLRTTEFRGWGGDPALLNTWTARQSQEAVILTQVTNRVAALEESMDSVSKRVSDGKQLIASAITDKGVTTLPSASYKEMATRIRMIETGGEAVTVEAIRPFKQSPIKANFNWAEITAFTVPNDSEDLSVFGSADTITYTSGHYCGDDAWELIYEECLSRIYGAIDSLIRELGLLGEYTKPLGDVDYSARTSFLCYEVARDLYLTVVNNRGLSGNNGFTMDIGYTTAIPEDGDAIPNNWVFQRVTAARSNYSEYAGDVWYYWSSFTLNRKRLKFGSKDCISFIGFNTSLRSSYDFTYNGGCEMNGTTLWNKFYADKDTSVQIGNNERLPEGDVIKVAGDWPLSLLPGCDSCIIYPRGYTRGVSRFNVVLTPRYELYYAVFPAGETPDILTKFNTNCNCLSLGGGYFGVKGARS